MEAYVKAMQGIAVRHGLVLSEAAQQMLAAAVREASRYPSFDLDEAIRSTELLIMAMGAERKGLHTAQSVIRAFGRTGPNLRPFKVAA